MSSRADVFEAVSEYEATGMRHDALHPEYQRYVDRMLRDFRRRGGATAMTMFAHS